MATGNNSAGLLIDPATGHINANTHKVINVTDPSSAQDAATKASSEAVVTEGRVRTALAALSASASVNSQKITSLANGSGAQDAAAFGQIPVVGVSGDLVAVTKAAASMGAVGKWADAGHKHDISTAAPGANLNGSSTNAEGSASTLARSDHAHAIDAATTSVAGLQSAADKQFRDRLFSDGVRSACVEDDDFCGGGENSSGAAAIATAHVFGKLNWRPTFSGTGAAITLVTTNQDSTHHGVIQLDTGTTNAGALAFGRFSASTPIRTFGAGQIFTQEWLVRIPTLSDGTNTYKFHCGWLSALSVASTDGIYFEFDSTASANWRGITRAASTSTVASGGSNVAVAAGSWIRLTITWDGTTVSFYVNGTLIGTSTTNIPSASISEAIAVTKSAGTTSRTILIDYFWQELVWTTPRAA